MAAQTEYQAVRRMELGTFVNRVLYDDLGCNCKSSCSGPLVLLR